MNKNTVCTLCLLAFAIIIIPFSSFKSTSMLNLSFTVVFNAELSDKPLDGRILLLLSKNNEKEPRFQINDGPNTQLVFGVDIENLEAGKKE